jgi:SagB-type dehydrogenase family enzyme
MAALRSVPDRKVPLRVPLPEPHIAGNVSVEEALRARRSVREFSREGLTLVELAQLLWAAQGVTDPQGFRTVPSAGALYPLEIYLVAGNVAALDPGVYRYDPRQNELHMAAGGGDRRASLADAALRQNWIAAAPVILVIAAAYQRSATKYGARAQRYVPIEAGHAAQAVALQVASLRLATVDVGAFEDAAVKRAVALPEGEEPLLILPVGRPLRYR